MSKEGAENDDEGTLPDTQSKQEDERKVKSPSALGH
jgi:hypothetical protein